MSEQQEALSRRAARGGLWGVAAEASSRASQSICFFVLAGVLSPAQFGAAAIAFVCVQVVNSLTYAGLGAAVQVLGRDVRRDRTAVGMALTSGLVGAAVLVALADPLCAALDTPQAVDLVRLVSLALPLAQTSEVLSALLDRDLRFRATGAAVVVASVVSAAVGLGLAAAHVGPAALVAQGVVQPGVRLLGLLLARPAGVRVALHRAQVAQLWHAGRELLVGSVFATASSNVDNIAVGAIAGAAALGGYGFVFNLTSLPFFLLGLALGKVALPVYARLLRQGEVLRPAFVTAIEASAGLAAVPLGFLAVAGPDALVVLFGHKWDPVAPALRVLSLNGWLRTIESTSGSALIAAGRAEVVRRMHQLQLAGVLVLLVPLVMWDGTLGAALAVTASVSVGTTYSLRRAATAAATPTSVLVRRLVEGALAGVVGGAAALLVLRTVPGFPGLALALAAAVVVGGAVLAALRPATARLVGAALRRAA